MAALATIAYASVGYWLFFGMLRDLRGNEKPSDVILCCAVMLLLGPALLCGLYIVGGINNLAHEIEFAAVMGETP